MLDVFILAAGKGTRMKSDLPKVLHPIAGKPMLGHVLDAAKHLNPSCLYVVVGHGAEKVEDKYASENVSIIQQREQLGTGHAVQQGLPHFTSNSTVLILYGDVPLIKPETLKQLTELVSDESLGLLTVQLENPTGYGRIVRDANNKVTSIVEQKDATAQEKAIKEVNTGIMAVKGSHLLEWLPKLDNNNAQKEYYLTDIIAMASDDAVEIKTSNPKNEYEVLGVNNRVQQAELERITQQEIAEQLLVDGATIMDPSRFDCRGSLSVGEDCIIDINCLFEGTVALGKNVSIGPNCSIKNATIGDNTVVAANSVIEDAIVESDCTIGPFARLRPGTHLKQKAKVGNFVETKKAVVGVGSKINHLSYVGDAELGDNVNVGAGTITCNYDGVNKFKTQIGNNVFVGSNSALVAPVSIAEGATIGAGSTITVDVKPEQLAVARQKQRNIDHWPRPKKK